MRSLGHLEAVVMKHLWSTDHALTVRDVLERLDREPPLAYTTVLTVMDMRDSLTPLRTELAGKGARFHASSGLPTSNASDLDARWAAVSSRS